MNTLVITVIAAAGYIVAYRLYRKFLTIIVATLFVKYPESVFPVWFQIPVAVWLGWQIIIAIKMDAYRWHFVII